MGPFMRTAEHRADTFVELGDDETALVSNKTLLARSCAALDS
jgi:hypothetical protein